MKKKSFRKNNLHNIRRTSREILFCPLTAFLFTLTSLLIINISNNNILKVEAAKRRLCGQRLTSELWRVCTKAGAKGPCIHGVKKRITTNQRISSSKKTISMEKLFKYFMEYALSIINEERLKIIIIITEWRKF
uniref:Uncharacterized protein n=1 Tax=Meloidogyne hapla TaxID=6305 RepID=A0A1I8B5H8_MELHA